MSNYIYYNGELYHHGVKGMRWGHRKPIISTEGSPNHKPLTQQEKQARNRKIATGVAIAAVGVAATGVAIYAIKHKKFKDLGSFDKHKTNAAKGAVKAGLDKIGQTNVNLFKGSKRSSNSSILGNRMAKKPNLASLIKQYDGFRSTPAY